MLTVSLELNQHAVFMSSASRNDERWRVSSTVAVTLHCMGEVGNPPFRDGSDMGETAG